MSEKRCLMFDRRGNVVKPVDCRSGYRGVCLYASTSEYSVTGKEWTLALKE